MREDITLTENNERVKPHNARTLEVVEYEAGTEDAYPVAVIRGPSGKVYATVNTTVEDLVMFCREVIEEYTSRDLAG